MTTIDLERLAADVQYLKDRLEPRQAPGLAAIRRVPCGRCHTAMACMQLASAITSLTGNSGSGAACRGASEHLVCRRAGCGALKGSPCLAPTAADASALLPPARLPRLRGQGPGLLHHVLLQQHQRRARLRGRRPAHGARAVRLFPIVYTLKYNSSHGPNMSISTSTSTSTHSGASGVSTGTSPATAAPAIRSR